MPQLHSIVSELKASRLAAGLTQSDVASLMGVNQPTVAKIENSDPANVSFNQVLSYSQALGMALDVSLTDLGTNRTAIRTAPLLDSFTDRSAVREWKPGTPPVLSLTSSTTLTWINIAGTTGVGKSVAAAQIASQLDTDTKIFLISASDDVKAYAHKLGVHADTITYLDVLDWGRDEENALARAIVSEQPVAVIHDGTHWGSTTRVLATLGDHQPVVLITTSQECVSSEVRPNVEITIERQGRGYQYGMFSSDRDLRFAEVLESSDPAENCSPTALVVDKASTGIAAIELAEQSASREMHIIDACRPETLPDELRALWTFDRVLPALDRTVDSTIVDRLSGLGLAEPDRAWALIQASDPECIHVGWSAWVERMRDGAEAPEKLMRLVGSTVDLIAENLDQFAGRGLIIQLPEGPNGKPLDVTGTSIGTIYRTARSRDVQVIFVTEGQA